MTSKFATEDKRYLTQRADISKRYGPVELWQTIDHWPLFVGASNLARHIAIAKLLEETLQVPGDIVEFGCWHGANLMFLAKMLRNMDPWSAKKIHGFDSFEGLVEFANEDGAYRPEKDRYKGNEGRLTDMIALYQMEDEINLHVGDILETLPAYLKDQAEQSFSFVYIDVDLYEPTRCILDNVDDRLSVGGLIVFDEWNMHRFPGETVAAREFIEITSGRYEQQHIARTRQPSLCLKKLSA